MQQPGRALEPMRSSTNQQQSGRTEYHFETRDVYEYDDPQIQSRVVPQTGSGSGSGSSLATPLVGAPKMKAKSNKKGSRGSGAGGGSLAQRRPLIEGASMNTMTTGTGAGPTQGTGLMSQKHKVSLMENYPVNEKTHSIDVKKYRNIMQGIEEGRSHANTAQQQRTPPPLALASNRIGTPPAWIGAPGQSNTARVGGDGGHFSLPPLAPGPTSARISGGADHMGNYNSLLPDGVGIGELPTHQQPGGPGFAGPPGLRTSSREKIFSMVHTSHDGKVTTRHTASRTQKRHHGKKQVERVVDLNDPAVDSLLADRSAALVAIFQEKLRQQHSYFTKRLEAATEVQTDRSRFSHSTVGPKSNTMWTRHEDNIPGEGRVLEQTSKHDSDNEKEEDDYSQSSGCSPLAGSGVASVGGHTAQMYHSQITLLDEQVAALQQSLGQSQKACGDLASELRAEQQRVADQGNEISTLHERTEELAKSLRTKSKPDTTEHSDPKVPVPESPPAQESAKSNPTDSRDQSPKHGDSKVSESPAQQQESAKSSLAHSRDQSPKPPAGSPPRVTSPIHTHRSHVATKDVISLVSADTQEEKIEERGAEEEAAPLAISKFDGSPRTARTAPFFPDKTKAAAAESAANSSKKNVKDPHVEEEERPLWELMQEEKAADLLKVIRQHYVSSSCQTVDEQPKEEKDDASSVAALRATIKKLEKQVAEIKPPGAAPSAATSRKASEASGFSRTSSREKRVSKSPNTKRREIRKSGDSTPSNAVTSVTSTPGLLTPFSNTPVPGGAVPQPDAEEESTHTAVPPATADATPESTETGAGADTKKDTAKDDDSWTGSDDGQQTDGAKSNADDSDTQGADDSENDDEEEEELDEEDGQFTTSQAGSESSHTGSRTERRKHKKSRGFALSINSPVGGEKARSPTRKPLPVDRPVMALTNLTTGSTGFLLVVGPEAKTAAWQTVALAAAKSSKAHVLLFDAEIVILTFSAPADGMQFAFENLSRHVGMAFDIYYPERSVSFGGFGVYEPKYIRGMRNLATYVGKGEIIIPSQVHRRYLQGSTVLDVMTIMRLEVTLHSSMEEDDLYSIHKEGANVTHFNAMALDGGAGGYLSGWAKKVRQVAAGKYTPEVAGYGRGGGPASPGDPGSSRRSRRNQPMHTPSGTQSLGQVPMTGDGASPTSPRSTTLLKGARSPFNKPMSSSMKSPLAKSGLGSSGNVQSNTNYPSSPGGELVLDPRDSPRDVSAKMKLVPFDWSNSLFSTVPSFHLVSYVWSLPAHLRAGAVGPNGGQRSPMAPSSQLEINAMASSSNVMNRAGAGSSNPNGDCYTSVSATQRVLILPSVVDQARAGTASRRPSSRNLASSGAGRAESLTPRGSFRESQVTMVDGPVVGGSLNVSPRPQSGGGGVESSTSPAIPTRRFAVHTGMQAFPLTLSANVGPAEDLMMSSKPTQTRVKVFRNKGTDTDDSPVNDEEALGDMGTSMRPDSGSENPPQAAVKKALPKALVERQKIIESMTCRVCKELFTEAHALHPCGHLYCGSCIESLAVRTECRHDNGQIEIEYRCPRKSCRQISLDLPMPIPAMDVAVEALKMKGFFIRM